ncbi:MAG: hypothetical protein ACXW3L_02870, partial [Limisphaerales bacterium]
MPARVYGEIKIVHRRLQFMRVWHSFLWLLVAAGIRGISSGADEFAAQLPEGVKEVWDIENAYRETTPSRGRICLNGLWRWQPAEPNSETVPTDRWGYFKVPGAWPGITDYMQKDCQAVFPHDSWKNERLGMIAAAWYEREFTMPEAWTGREILITSEYLNSFAAVYVDGKKAGEMRFPAGRVDISPFCRPNHKHRLSILVAALPLKAVLTSYTDSAAAREIRGSVARRGLCGDVFLEGIRPGPRIENVQVDTSYRRGEILVNAKLLHAPSDLPYRLRVEIKEADKTVLSFDREEIFKDQSVTVRHGWKPQRLWDVHTSQNQYRAVLKLIGPGNQLVDASSPVTFGFRELWIDGRDFYLNGSRIFLSAVPLDNAQVGAAWATYEGARESLERLKSFGINFVYTHNYDCRPGSHLSFSEVLRAADDVGMLVALSQPHFSDYDWKAPDAETSNGYAEHARFYAKVAANHPSVVFYSMSHNATGYSEDMNPFMIDGIQDGRDSWASNNAKLAMRAEKIVTAIDPDRIVYHHASGNLGTMHPINFYPNFVPPQEMSDWFGHWATNGVKPAFLCEYGAPFTWDWTMYRGWYKGQREFGSAKVPWEFCIAEWNAQFFGDRAYEISEAEKTNLRWEAKQFAAGNVWHRWDYPHAVGSSVFDERFPVFALYLKQNWRAFRGWGVSATSPWEYEHFWKLRPGVNKSRTELKVDWENLQRPGYSADYVGQRYERMDLAFDKDDWLPTAAAQALIEHSGPLLGFIAGEQSAFTSQDHLFLPGEPLEKQLIVINNSREEVTCRMEWSFDLPEGMKGKREVTLPTGQQIRVPLGLQLPAQLAPGKYNLTARFDFGKAVFQQDSFAINILPEPGVPEVRARIAVFDPIGETRKWLSEIDVSYERIDAAANLWGYDLLIIGKNSLSLQGPAPDISRVRDGLRVVVFEQKAQVLEKRLGFRVIEYGLRNVFPRVPDDPLLSGVTADYLRDWRGDATLVSPGLTYELRPRHGPTVKWCDIPVTRLWRCGNRGNVASVLIEKPAGGDVLPIIDGGYALQYSPLLEYREGKGSVLFCQMDVTGRTENDPVAEKLLWNILTNFPDRELPPRHTVTYMGEPAGKQFLEAIGVEVQSSRTRELSPESLLIVGPGAKLSVDEKVAIARN